MYEQFSPGLNGLAESNGAIAVVDRPVSGRSVKAAKRVEVDLPIWTEVVDLTPELAATLVQSCHYPYQRPVRKKHVEFLKSEIRAGRLSPTTVRVCHLGPQAFMTDAQHRCHAVIESGIAIPAVILHMRKDTMEEVEADYHRTDIGAKRTPADSFMKVKAESGMSTWQVNAIGSASVLIAQGFLDTDTARNMARSRDERLKAITEWLPVARTYLETVGKAEGDLLKILRTRVPVVAVGLVTTKDCPEKAETFWKTVAENEALLRGEPERTLIQWLLSTKSHSHPLHIYARYVSSAWNASYESRELHRLFPQANGTAIDIKGTRFGRREEVKKS